MDEVFETPFNIFSREWRKDHVEQTKDLTYLEVSRKIASIWASFNPTEKLEYYERAGVPKAYQGFMKKKRSRDDGFDHKPYRKKNKAHSAYELEDESDSEGPYKEKKRIRKSSSRSSDLDKPKQGRRKYTRRNLDYD